MKKCEILDQQSKGFQYKQNNPELEFNLDSLPSNQMDQNNDAEDSLRIKGIYYITGEIDSNNLLPIQQDILLKHLTPDWKDDIQIFINSAGGSTTETWAFIDLLHFIRMNVWTTVIGEASSAGAIILASGTSGMRRAAPNASIMIHQFFGGMAGNYAEIAAQSKDIELEQARHLRFWTQCSNLKTKEEVEKKLLLRVDNYLSPLQALEFGIIDTILGQEKNEVCNIDRDVLESAVASQPQPETTKKEKPNKIVCPIRRTTKSIRNGVGVLVKKRRGK